MLINDAFAGGDGGLAIVELAELLALGLVHEVIVVVHVNRVAASHDVP